MDLSGHTQPFAVLGHPIGHTLSPVMHNAAFEALGMDAIYLAFDVAPDRLGAVLPAMGEMGFRGVNLTVPLKEVAFRQLTDVADDARRLGAVNTVEFLGDRLRGHNTDGIGFLLALDEAFGRGPRGLAIFVLGTGGAGRAVAITAAVEGAGTLMLCDAEPDRAAGVADEMARWAPGVPVEVVDADPSAWPAAARAADLVVQATPVGMAPSDATLLPPAAFAEGQMVFDLIYMYRETVLMQAARAAGARCANGLGMLLHQGAFAFEIWTGRKPAVAAMRRALESAVYGRDAASGDATERDDHA
jgi:shikimate dehydrogenase